MTDRPTQNQTQETPGIQGALDTLKKDTLTMLITLGKELDQLEAKKQEFVQLFKAYDALATPKERQVYQQMMTQK